MATCVISCKDTVLLLEKESIITVRIKGRNARTKVSASGGEIRSVRGDDYKIRMFEPGTLVIRVYQEVSTGTKLIGIREFMIRAPELFFCGLKIGSISHVLKLGKCHMYAWSDYYKKNLPVNKFTMLYYEDIVRASDKPKVDTLKADTCRLTGAMRQRLMKFQPKTNKIYFYNLLCSIPDGTYRLLEPVELRVQMDTAVSTTRVMYSLRKKPNDDSQ